jgi:hypothetical protein
MKKLKKALTMISVILITILSTSCSSNNSNPAPTPAACDASSTNFQTIFGTGGRVSYDFDVHSYTFKVASNKTICKIGYQSTAYNTSNPYTIKILQGTSTIYNQAHVFSSTATSYITPSSTINLTAGVVYTIERIQTNSSPSNFENWGRIKGVAFPLSSGDLTITGSKFYFDPTYVNPATGFPNGTSTINGGDLPFIDIVFQ